MYRSTNTVSPATHVNFGTCDATAPRSARYGSGSRGSREGSLHSPARDPRLFHRPLRGRGFVAPRSRNRLLRGRGIVAPRSRIRRSAVAESSLRGRGIVAPRSRNRRSTVAESSLRGRGLRNGLASETRTPATADLRRRRPQESTPHSPPVSSKGVRRSRMGNSLCAASVALHFGATRLLATLQESAPCIARQ